MKSEARVELLAKAWREYMPDAGDMGAVEVSLMDARWWLRAIAALAPADPVEPEAWEKEVEHCKDCCCARSWKALGITTYTGRSIPEEIERLRATPVQAEPVAWQYKSGSASFWANCSEDFVRRMKGYPAVEIRPLYTHPSEPEGPE